MDRTVLDTNVVYAVIRSKLGASYHLLSLLPDRRFKTVVTTSLLLEYEDVLTRPDEKVRMSSAARQDILNYLCEVSVRQKVHFLWRPWLRDPSDDMVLEAAVASSASTIITFNLKDFTGAARLGIKIQPPAEFLKSIGETPWQP